MAINFEKYANEGNQFINSLAKHYGHPGETARTGIFLRAVLHTLRDRISISQSFHLLSQMPMFIKAIYVDNWKYHEKPIHLKTKEEFTSEVERHQKQYGEQDFSWQQSTEEMIKIFFKQMSSYVSEGEFEDLRSQLPKGLHDLFVVKGNH